MRTRTICSPGWLEDFLVSREQYVQTARYQAVTTFAVVKDGRWHEKGEVGYWGTASDEKPEVEWVAGFNRMLDSVPDDARLTLIDCHI